MHAVLALALTFAPAALPLAAQAGTSYTYTRSAVKEWTRTQDAYLPGATLLLDRNLLTPEDLVVGGDRLYVADSGNGRVLVTGLDGEGPDLEIGKGLLVDPTGLCLGPDNTLYVADPAAKSLFVFDQTGKLLRSLGRPTSASFGVDAAWNPAKVAVDARGVIYVVSTGSYDGLVELASDGSFLGYFGANKTRLSPLEALQNLVLSDAQLNRLANRIPQSTENLTLDGEGMVWTLTRTTEAGAVKKHDISGANILAASLDGRMATEANFRDLTIGRWGQVLCVSENGVLYEYDATGRLLFAFGGKATTSERSGLSTVAAGLAVGADDSLYVLDRERSLVQAWHPTALADLYHQAMDLFARGDYAASGELWRQAIALSSLSRGAHESLGTVLYYAGDYAAAAHEFVLAGDKSGYSDAFWELRDKALQTGIVPFLALLVGLVVLYRVARRVLAGRFQPGRVAVLRRLGRLGGILRHPILTLYDLRTDATWGTTLAVYGLLFATLVLRQAGSGFLWAPQGTERQALETLVWIFVVTLGLWTGGNTLIANINDGRGRFQDIFAGTAFALAPWIVISPLTTAATWVLTRNEAFLVDFADTVALSWCALNLFLLAKEMHDYTVRETVRNLLTTVFFMAVAVLAASFGWIFFDRMLNFFFTLLQEVANHAKL